MGKGCKALTALAPPGPRSLAAVVNRWARSISRSFMAEQGREGCEQEQGCLNYRIQVIISNSPSTGAADAEICRNALATPRVSSQRSAGASGPNDSAHQGEWECHSGRQPIRKGTRMAHCVAISHAVLIEDADMRATHHDRRPHAVSCH